MFFSNSLSMNYEGQFSMIVSELCHTAGRNRRKKRMQTDDSSH